MKEEKLIDIAEFTLQTIADKIVKETSEIMGTAYSEEDLRIGFEKILEKYLKQINVKSYPKYEKSIFEVGKRTDALHGQVIIEYEKPYAFKSQQWINHAYEQLVEYICGVAEENKDTLYLFKPKYIGVGFDGKQIFFVQYKGEKEKAKTKFDRKDFALIGPYDFEQETARTLLTYFRALSKLLLTSENLTQIYGPSSKIAHNAVTALVDALKKWSNPKTEVFYNEWKRLFGIVYGEQFNNHTNDDFKELSNLYKTKEADFQELLFCVHTYFAFLMKIIAVELLELKESTLVSSYSHRMVHLSKADFEKQLIDIEEGGIYAKRGITNFLEGDFFRWYLNAIESTQLYDVLREIIRALSEFEPATSIITPEATKDLLKKLYQYLVPREVRHKLGEYYTPDWLAELTINEVGFDGNTLKRVLDPACGSGTFLVLAIQKAKEFAKKNKEKRLETAKRIVNNIWGFDLNPLAIIASRTNYLFALGDLVESLPQIEIPVYLADSVLWPERTSGQLEIEPQFGKHVKMHTSIRPFHVPHIWIIDNGILMHKAAPLIEKMVKDNFESEIALKHLKEAGCVFPPHEKTVENFYNEILTLEKEGKNGIWARFLKNAFAPMMAGKFDFVIGNPPWVRWGYLSTEYRKATLELWKNYGLFSLKGQAALLGGGEKDFSMLFVYAASDYYLKNGSKLGFLITQEVFKSKGAGEGFRKFSFGNNGKNNTYLKILKAHDLVLIKPFEGAANKTAAIFIKKGEKTKYPVPYYLWTKKKGVGKIPTDMPIEEVLLRLNKSKLSAKPIDSEFGSWQTINEKQKKLVKISGNNYYKARRGASTEPYGVYWITLKNIFSDNTILVNNLFDRGKREIPSVEERIESDLIFPIVSGREIERWKAVPINYIIMTQDPKTSEPYPETIMKKDWPRTFNYFVKFKNILLTRGSNTVRHLAERTSFYAMFGIGEYTVARYKVVWKRMANDIFASVISQFKTPFGYKKIIPSDTTSLFATTNNNEAHYICAIINSTTIREFIKSFSSAGRGFGAPSVMNHVGILKFDPNNNIHKKLCDLSKQLHTLKEEDKYFNIENFLKEVDEWVFKLFGIS